MSIAGFVLVAEEVAKIARSGCIISSTFATNVTRSPVQCVGTPSSEV